MIVKVKQIVIFVLAILIIENESSELFGPLRYIVNKARDPSNTILDLSRQFIDLQDSLILAELLRTTLNHITTLNLSESANLIDVIPSFITLLSALKYTNITNLIIRKYPLTDSTLQLLSTELPYTKLRTIDLSGNKNLKEQTIINLFEQLKQTNVTELMLNSMGLNDNAVNILAEELKQTKINKISLDDNLITIKSFQPLLTNILEKNIEYSINENHLGDDGVAFMINQLKAHDKTEFILRNDRIGFAGMVSVVKALKNSNFKIVDLRGNHLSTSSLIALSSILKYTKIHTLKLGFNEFTDSTMQMMEKYLLSKSLKYLQLNDGDFLTGNRLKMTDILNTMDVVEISLKLQRALDENVAEEIVERLKLTRVNNLTLDIDAVSVGTNEANSIAKILTNLNLQVLSLNYADEFNTESIRIISAALVQSKLNYLTINRGYIGVEEMEMLSAVLRNTKLISLDLRDMNFYAREMTVLMNGLIGSRVINLRLDKVFTQKETVQAIIDNLNRTGIATLSLINDDLNDDDLKALSNILPSTKIRELNLKDNKMNDGVKRLAEVLKYTQITSLNLEGNNVGDDSLNAIADVLCQTKVIDLKVHLPDTILDKINKCLHQNQVNFARETANHVEADRQLSRINRLELNNNNQRLDADDMIVYLANIIKALPITEIDITDTVQIDFNDDKSISMIEDALSVNKVLLSIKTTDHYPKLESLLNGNLMAFKRAQKVVKSFESNMTQQCSDNDFNSFYQFIDTINLWDGKKDADDLKNKVKLEINQVKARRKASNILMSFFLYTFQANAPVFKNVFPRKSL